MAHIEGGYYKRTYQASNKLLVNDHQQERFALTSIYYMLTYDSPIGHWHKNKSDILHFYHSGSALTYWILTEEGCLKKYTLGADIVQGQQLQLLVPGGCWKATQLESGEYGLLSEVVTPGFEFEDMVLATNNDIKPFVSKEQWEVVKHFIKQKAE